MSFKTGFTVGVINFLTDGSSNLVSSVNIRITSDNMNYQEYLSVVTCDHLGNCVRMS